MPFSFILNDMLSHTDGSIGAMFLDQGGETVAVAGNCSLYDLKVIGAYQGIFLDQLKRLCSNLSYGEPESFKIELNGSSFLCYVLKDGYYVVLVVEKGAPEAIAWRQLARCREMLLNEI